MIRVQQPTAERLTNRLVIVVVIVGGVGIQVGAGPNLNLQFSICNPCSDLETDIETGSIETRGTAVRSHRDKWVLGQRKRVVDENTSSATE